ncbi:MAG: dTDP-glucose 4,6-dehydratase [Armatimonadetes bacterium]|nr:dTDP-glucose 4,6-dehydratase [Armatimonadota bacterium]
MNILVTGGAGFIGSNYCRLVLNRRPGDCVVVFDALTYAGNLSTIEDLERNERFRFREGRIEDPGAVRRVLKEHRIEAIVNFAAETHNDRSLLAAGDFLRTNVIGVHVLLDCAREAGVNRFVQVSTDEVYGSIEEGEFTEESPLQPNTPYSASKAAGDLQCRAHFVAYGVPVIVTRGGNTYGAFQYPEKLISFFTTRLMDGKKVPVYGEGNQVREWIHVEDHCSGIDVVLRNGRPGEIYNIGDRNERRNMEIVDVLLDELDKPRELVKHIPDPRKGAHDKRYSMNADKIRALGWEPAVPFDEGLRATIRWYEENEQWWRAICAEPEYQAFAQAFYGPGLGDDL